MNPEAPLPSPHAQLAAALGVPLYACEWYMPRYQPGQYGNWSLKHCQFHLEPGYFSGIWAVADMPLLLRDTGAGENSWETWMSLSPHEIESQELPLYHASGHVVVMGLGMGWVAVNLAFLPEVERVTVVERDPDVIALLELSGALNGIPGEIAAKLEIVRADALTWVPSEPVDFLYADIWRDLEEPQTVSQVQRMQANVRAKEVYFWGQEPALFDAAAALPPGAAEETPAKRLQRAAREVLGLPLLLPTDIDYPSLVERVVQQRRERHLR